MPFSLKLRRSPLHFLQGPDVAIGVAESSVLDALVVFLVHAHFNSLAKERFVCLVDVSDHQMQPLDRSRLHLYIGQTSPGDIEVTKLLIKAGELREIKMLDHLIIGQGRWVSMCEQGLGWWRVETMIEKKRSEENERLILGIDPGFGRMGYAVVAAVGNEQQSHQAQMKPLSKPRGVYCFCQ